jgi:V/A-type H+-transporting ATPase subunit E
MTEDLQHLLDKIQKDGVDKAETDSANIVNEAKLKADDIVKKAGNEAKQIIDKAKKEAVAFEENGRKALEQASRDVIISAKTGIQAAVSSVVTAKTSKAMDDQTLSAILIKVVETYCSDSKSTDVLVSESDVESFKQFILAGLNEEARQGINIVPEGSIAKGFKVVIKDKNMELDLTDKAVGEALSKVLRPHIAEILNKSV